MEKLSLSANSRTLLGKKVKTLRLAGVVPANIYGKGLESVAIAMEDKTFRNVLKTAGETGVIYVKLEGEDSEHPVLVHEVQRHPVTGQILHVDFYQVNLKEKTTANVPLILVGENDLEKSGEGMIIQTLNEIEVEALPTDIPHEFEIDVTKLAEIGQSVKVGDLVYDRDKVEIMTDPDENILVMQTAEAPEEPEEEVVAEGELPEVIGEEGQGEEGEDGGAEGSKEEAAAA